MSVARWPERGKGRGLGGSPRPHVLGHAANGPPDMRLVSVYTAGSSPNRAGEFWFPFNAPLPRWTAANQGARIVAVPHDATASPKKKPVPTACPPLNVAVTVPVPPAARLRLDAPSEKKPFAGGALIVRLRPRVTAAPRFWKVTWPAEENANWPARTLESTRTPGAVTSGLRRKSYGVGPRLENAARMSAFVVTKSKNVVPSTVTDPGACALRVAPSAKETMTAGIVGWCTP